MTAADLDRGQERFNIYCTPCHDQSGSGDGMVVRRGYRQPPSFHIDRLKQADAGYIFDVITNGFGAMPDYKAQIDVRDRWRDRRPTSGHCNGARRGGRRRDGFRHRRHGRPAPGAQPTGRGGH